MSVRVAFDSRIINTGRAAAQKYLKFQIAVCVAVHIIPRLVAVIFTVFTIGIGGQIIAAGIIIIAPNKMIGCGVRSAVKYQPVIFGINQRRIGRKSNINPSV